MKRNVVAIDKTTTKDTWCTPPAVFAALNEQFGPFDLDLTANAENHLCERWMGPGSTQSAIYPDKHRTPDALTARWRDFGSRGYTNPPYGRSFVPQLLAKAALEASEGFDTTLLLPLRVTQAFRQWIIGYASTLYYCDRRICFWEDGHPRWNAKKLNPPCLTCEGTGSLDIVTCPDCVGSGTRGKEHGKRVPDPAMFDSIVVRFDPHVLLSSSLRTDIFKVPPHTDPRHWDAWKVGHTDTGK